jgi:hypothetical protein
MLDSWVGTAKGRYHLLADPKRRIGILNQKFASIKDDD